MTLFYKNYFEGYTFVSHSLKNKENRKAFFKKAKKIGITLYRIKCELKLKL